jgi:ATP phosphoribosyltransferase regulatory subunit
MNPATLSTQERIMFELRELYLGYGYRPYKVGKFEEYDFYMRNKKFLASERVLSFSDTNGKLKALKPDVTLSIVKNVKDDGGAQKLCYTETVYRVPHNAYGFREIMQTGLECIGRVDDYAAAEVLMLAARSLGRISENYVLDVSDVGVLSGVLAEEPIGDAECARLLGCVGEKNLHGLDALCDELALSGLTRRRLSALVRACGPLGQTLDEVEQLDLPQSSREALRGLGRMDKMLKEYKISNVNLDFSVVNDMDYYNGVVFRGFVEGIPSGVLSGGRYDNLLARMGKGGEAIGFAVYLDQLERYMETKHAYEPDALVLYGDGDDPLLIAREAEKLRARGLSVRVQRENEPRPNCRETVRIAKGAGA